MTTELSLLSPFSVSVIAVLVDGAEQVAVLPSSKLEAGSKLVEGLHVEATLEDC